MAKVTVHKDGSVTVDTTDEDAGPTGAVAYSEEPVTTTFDGSAGAEAKVVEPATTESKTVRKTAKKKA